MAAVAQKSGIFSRKKLASLTGNTGEALQCVRLHQKAPEGACRQFKLPTQNIFISGTLRRCLRWDLVLEAEKKFLQLRKKHSSGQLSFSEGDFMRVWDPHLFIRVSRPVFEKPGIAPVFLIVLKGFTTVFNGGIDNGSPLYVAIIGTVWQDRKSVV